MDLKSDLYQNVRIADVVLLAPLMVYAGFRAKDLHPAVRTALITAGVATFTFNANNYIQIEKAKKDSSSV